MSHHKPRQFTDLSDETAKRVLLIKGKSSSQVMNDVLLDLTMLTKPNNKALTRNNDILPFEDVNSLEFLGGKNRCSLFSLVSHTKKRPNNLVLGRFFDGHVLDMVEFGVDDKKSMLEFAGDKKGMGSKPLLLFMGDQWESDNLYKSIQNLFIDFFRGDKADKLSLKGVDHALGFTCIDGKIHIRAYNLGYQKSDSKVPNLSMLPMGPFYDLTVRRSQLPSPDMWKAAVQKDKRVKIAKVKNIKRSALGDKLGRIHMKPQNLDNMGGRRVDALRNRNKRPASADGGRGANKKSRG